MGNIEQPEDGVIAFDVIASCDVEMPSTSRKGYFNEQWLKIHCQVTLGIDMSGFRIMAIGNCEPQEESDNDRLSGELVPIISHDQFDDEAEKFLTRYCPEALDQPMRVPIETIASDMKLQVIEDVPLSDDLAYFGTIIFDSGNVLDKHRKIAIRNAKRGTVYLDPRVSYERSVGTKRTTLAHECFHWHRHQPYHVLMKMIGANDNLGKAIQCQIAANTTDSDKWKAVDWMEWQAKGVAPRILMPAKTTRLKADQLLAEYGEADEASVAAYENVIDELAELFDVSRQAAKVRLIDLGYSKAEGAYPFVDGQYVRGYSFDAGTLDNSVTGIWTLTETGLSVDMTDELASEIFKSGVSDIVAKRNEKNALGDADVETVHYWLYSPGEGAFLWDDCYQHGVMRLGWHELGDLNTFTSKEEMAEKLRELRGGDSSYKNSAHAVWQFVHELKPGDIVFAIQPSRNALQGNHSSVHRTSRLTIRPLPSIFQGLDGLTVYFTEGSREM